MKSYLTHLNWLNWGRSALLASFGLALLFFFWHLGSQALAEKLPLARLIAPNEALASLKSLLFSGSLTSDILASLKRVAVSLLLALLIGLPVGLALGLSKTLETTSSGALQLLRMVSPLSWMPLAVMLLGIGDAPIYLLLTLGAVWPIILNTSVGVRNLNPSWLALAASLSATKFEVLTKIILPAILGQILTGLRLAIGIIWVLLVPCEMLGVTDGLGYFILDTRDRLAYNELMAAILLIGCLGWLLDSLAKKLQSSWAH